MSFNSFFFKIKDFNFYKEKMEKDKVILITGVAGFIASHVIEYLVQAYPDNHFVGIDKMSYCSNRKNLADIEKCSNFEFIVADITNLDLMMYIFEQYNVDIVMHFAAYTHVDNSFGNSIEFTKNNVIGTHNLLEVCKQLGIDKFIHVSTDEVYGCQEGESFEHSILDPTNPYAATKAAAEQLVRSYGTSFKIPYIITRGNNVYGPRQYPEKLIPKFITALKNDEKLTIQGNGKQLRSFLYISDVVRAFEIILLKGVIGEIYNIGCTDEHSVLDVTERICNLFGIEHWQDYCDWVQDRDFNDKRYLINTDKIEALGWKQEIDFDTGLNLTFNWYCD